MEFRESYLEDGFRNALSSFVPMIVLGHRYRETKSIALLTLLQDARVLFQHLHFQRHKASKAKVMSTQAGAERTSESWYVYLSL